jgi:MoaA/NifB/PqqE/SkfB family radical SAM enzyme
MINPDQVSSVNQNESLNSKIERNKEFLSKTVIDLFITGRCDMKCPFCYGAKVPSLVQTEQGNQFVYKPTNETIDLNGTSEPRPEMTASEIKKVLIRLKRLGVYKLNIGGGEPLLREDTPEIIKFAKDLGFRIYISTNGTYTQKLWTEFKEYVDVIGLSLDGSINEKNVMMGRKDKAIDRIIGFLNFLKDQTYQHEIKIGTVVSKVNIDDIENIGNLLLKNPNIVKPDVWRLYQFESIGEGLENKNNYHITDEEYSQVVAMVNEKFPDESISYRSNSDHNNSYLFVSPDGMLQTVDTQHNSILDIKNANTEAIFSTLISRDETVNRTTENREWAFEKSKEGYEL